MFELSDDEIEMGVGVHGEPGRRRAKMMSANETFEELLTPVEKDLPFEDGDRVALMVSGLGGVPITDLYLRYGLAHTRLVKQGITAGRNNVGSTTRP